MNVNETRDPEKVMTGFPLDNGIAGLVIDSLLIIKCYPLARNDKEYGMTHGMLASSL